MTHCTREDELLDALARGYVGPELESHAATCVSCGELASVAGALLDDRTQAMLEAPVPSAGTMWFRMHLRERQEAEARARRSLLIGQAATLAVALALLIVLLGTDVAAVATHFVAMVRASTPLLVALAFIVAAPLAGFVALGVRR